MTSGVEWLIIGVVIVAVFGAGWLPKAARNLGRAKVELDKTKRQIDETTQQVADATGMTQVNKGLQTARKLSNQTPQQLLKGAAISAASSSTSSSAQPGAADGKTGTTDDSADDQTSANETASSSTGVTAANPEPSVQADPTSATVNLDFTD